MDWIDVAFSIVIALLITFVFAVAFKSKGPWGSVWAFFLIIFLAVWAASIWVSPAGPLLFGYSLIPIGIVGVIFALIIASAAPPDSRESIRYKKDGPDLPGKSFISGFSIYFWLVLLILSIIIIFGYFML